LSKIEQEEGRSKRVIIKLNKEFENEDVPKTEKEETEALKL